MSFGIGNNVRSKVRECTPELFNRAMESQVVAEVCAQIKDALEAVRRGEMSPEDFETLKGNLKKALIIFTFHATFKNGSRKNDDAIPSGLSIYDLDHIPNPEGRWKEIEPRKEELGIVLAHITPSSEGLRLVFIIPQGMNLEQAQAWMARQLGDDKYDACVKDFARCSFAVPREYVLFVDEEKLFAPTIPLVKGEVKTIMESMMYFQTPSKASHTPPSSKNGSSKMEENRKWENAIPSFIDWHHTYDTSPITTKNICSKSYRTMV